MHGDIIVSSYIWIYSVSTDNNYRGPPPLSKDRVDQNITYNYKVPLPPLNMQ